MNYKTDNEFWKDTILFRCQCGSYEFLEISKLSFDDAEPIYFVCIMSRPDNIFDRLKYLFKPEKYVKEIILTKDDIVELGKAIKLLQLLDKE